MAIENEVPQLEISKRLRDLGYPQEGASFYWINYSFDQFTCSHVSFYLVSASELYHLRDEYSFPVDMQIIAAPLIGEMLERLPDFVNDCQLNIWKAINIFCLQYVNAKTKEAYPPLENGAIYSEQGAANSYALMVEYLVKNNLLKFDGKGK